MKSPQEEMQQLYRNTFASPEGRKVLGDIIEMGHVFDNIDPHDAVMAAEKNFALTIMKLSGAFDLIYSQLGIPTKDTSGQIPE